MDKDIDIFIRVYTTKVDPHKKVVKYTSYIYFSTTEPQKSPGNVDYQTHKLVYGCVLPNSMPLDPTEVDELIDLVPNINVSHTRVNRVKQPTVATLNKNGSDLDLFDILDNLFMT